MKQFRYEAKKGLDSVKGILSAETQNEAIDKINEMGLVPVEVTEEDAREQEKALSSEGNLFAAKIKNRSLAIFFRQLGRLLKSGVPLLPALALITEQPEDKKLQPILEDIKSQVRDGRSLMEAMTRYPSIFNFFATSMIDLGESTGHLDEALCRLAESYEQQLQTHQKIKDALLYPAFVICLGAAALVFLLGYVVPKFSVLFRELGQSLPLPTRLLLKISEIIQHYGLGLIFIFVVIIFLARNYLKVPSHRMHWDRIKMKCPIMGKMIFMAQFAVFARSIEMLLKSGVPLLKALRVAIPTVSNEAMKDALFQVTQRVEQGAALSEALKVSGIFPLFSVHLLMIGEQTGRLEQSFTDIADWYDQEVREYTRMMTQFIEPVTILALGISLGFVAIAILLPVFSIDAIVS